MTKATPSKLNNSRGAKIYRRAPMKKSTLRQTLLAELLIVSCLSVAVVSCGSDGDGNGASSSTPDAADTETTGTDDGTAKDDAMTQFAPFRDDCTITTGPADSAEQTTKNLERAFVQIESGSVVCLVDGTYKVKRELTVNASNVAIRGQSQEGTVLDFAPQNEGANGILAQSKRNFAAANFTVKNTSSDALKAKGTDGVVMKNITVTWDRGPSPKNAAYALYPVEAKNVLIEGSKISYARDAGVYLGQSKNAIIRNNETFGNVIGIEVENTFRAAVYDNNTHDNSNGILVINLPDLQVKGGGKNLVYDNSVKNNNQDNFAKEGTTAASMPAGSGILVVVADNNEIRNNTIQSNQSVGIGVVSAILLNDSGSDDEKYDPMPEGNWIHDNTLKDNGGSPKGQANVAARDDGTVPQVFWDGQFDDEKDNTDGSLTNCFQNNETPDGTAIELGFIGATNQCKDEAASSKFCQNNCSHSALSEVTLPDRVLEMAK